MEPATHVHLDPSGVSLLKDMADVEEAYERGLTLIQKEQASYMPLEYEALAAKQPSAKRNKANQITPLANG